MKPLHAINRIKPFLLSALFAVLTAPLLPGGHVRAQQALTATPTATPGPPAIPGNFSGQLTDNGILLSWTASAGGADSYWIRRMWPRNKRTNAPILYLVGSATSFTDSDIAVAGSYSYTISATRYKIGESRVFQHSGWSGTLTVAVPESAVPTATGTPVPSTATPTPTPTSVPPGFQTPTPTATSGPPAIPGNFSGKVTDKGIVLSWTAPAGGADSYWIYRSWPRHSRGGFIVSYRPPGSATSFTDKDVAVPGGHYRYHIQAIRGGWGSGYSDLLTVVVPANAVPTATGTPVPSTATPTATPTSAPPGFQTPTPTATPANRGRGLSGDGAPELTATPTPASALSVPQLTAQASANAVELRWTEVSGAVRYELMVWWDPLSGWQPIGGANLTGTAYTHTNVTAGTTYYYTIRAVNAAGETSGWLGAGTNRYPSVTASQEVPAGATSTATPTPTATAAALSTPALTAAAAEGGVTLRWGAVQGAVRYDLMAWWDADTGWQPIGGANLTGASYTHTGVSAGTTYYYTIRAVNAAGGASAWQLQYASATAVPPL
ncbi:MAG: fibronectin type III domain-containing protein [Chloroflexi bacterium]|nr:fibronectin type III domain-containing protein [Chloroflexota bacterium]